MKSSFLNIDTLYILDDYDNKEEGTISGTEVGSLDKIQNVS